MKLIIDIPEGLKKDFELEQWTALSCMEMKNALETATPIPKGHGKIADIDKVLEEMKATRTYDIPFALERVQPLLEADKTEMLELPSLEDVKKLPDTIRMCKAPDNYTGEKDFENFCKWWVNSKGFFISQAALVHENGQINSHGDDVNKSFGVRPLLHIKTDKLSKDKYGYVNYGKLPDGSDIKWIDVSKYLGPNKLLMKECLPKAKKFNNKIYNYETSPIKKYLNELETHLFKDNDIAKEMEEFEI